MFRIGNDFIELSASPRFGEKWGRENRRISSDFDKTTKPTGPAQGETGLRAARRPG
jgi:hypothetical protein